VAIEVIRIGRRRRRDASRIAVAMSRAGVAQLVGELDDQDAVLGGEADQHDDSDLAVEVERLAHQREPDDSARHRERHGGDDHRRVDEALELGGEQQIDEQDGEAKTIRSIRPLP
jgi:hypothetical protein